MKTLLQFAAVLFASTILLTWVAAQGHGTGHGNNTAEALRHVTAHFTELAEALPTQPLFFHDDHGNSPTWQWVGVNVAGSLFAMPADEYLILATLTDLDGLAMAASNAGQCGELAILICGKGEICCFCFSGNGNQACSFSCQDAAGDCEPCPECGPDISDVPDFRAY